MNRIFTSCQHPPTRRMVAASVFAVLAALVALTAPAHGLETDQFTVPPQPLVDLAPQFRQHVIAMLQETVVETNALHAKLAKQARRAPRGVWPDQIQKQADRCLTPDFIAHAYFDKVGK